MKNTGSMTRMGSCVAMAIFLVGCVSNSPAPVVGRDGQSVPTQAAAKDVYIVKSGDTLYSIAREHGMDHRELIALNNIENPNHITVGRALKVRTQGGGGATASPIVSPVVVAQPLSAEPLVEKRPLTSGTSTETFKREPKAGKEPYSDQALAQAQGSSPPRAEVPKAVEAAAAVSEKPVETKAPEVAASGNDEVAWIWPASGKTVGTFSESGSKGVDIAGKAGDPVIAAADGRVVYSGTGLRGYGKLVILKHNNTYLSAYAHNQNILVKEGQSVSKGQKIAEMGNTDADQVKLHFEVRRQGKPVDPLKYLPVR